MVKNVLPIIYYPLGNLGESCSCFCWITTLLCGRILGDEQTADLLERRFIRIRTLCNTPLSVMVVEVTQATVVVATLAIGLEMMIAEGVDGMLTVPTKSVKRRFSPPMFFGEKN